MAIQNTHYGSSLIGEMLKNCRSVYFIGIGGINMSSLAELTARQGYRVGGSDRTETELTRRLAEKGISIFYGHSAAQVEDFDAVVYTVAISEDNPEFLRARERGIPCISRADYLGYVMTAYPWRVGFSGMHGKSSTTSMCAHTMLAAGVDPTVLSGAELREMGGAYHVGEGRHFVFEACEYMDSFLDFYPTVAVILNVEMDHVDYFKSMDQIRSSFGRYAAKTGKDGYAVVNGDDADAMDSVKDYEGTLVTFGLGETVDFRATDLIEQRGRYSFDIWKRGERFGHVSLSVPGRHHVYNALACAAACELGGLSREEILRGISSFTGAARRMEYRGTLGGACVYDDYGHHPTEIRTTLTGAKALPEEGGRLLCVYQPHTYSRTVALLEEFSSAFGEADRVFFMDIYAARETNEWGISSEILAERVGERGVYGGSPQRTAGLVLDEIRRGDVLVVMGAGDLYKIYDYLNVQETEL